MYRSHCGRIFVVQILLSLGAAAAHADFQIRDGRLVHGEQPFPVRGVVYTSVPVGQTWSDTAAASGCYYARDFPLIAGAGANTIRTPAKIPPGDRAFRQSLAEADLYWLAGFPLDRFYDPRQSLTPDSAQGRALRDQILTEFRDYVQGWQDEPRLIAFVFGEEVGTRYQEKFSGSLRDFFSLLQEAAGVLREVAGADAPLLTTTVSTIAAIGSFANASDDGSQPGLAFWSLNRLGDESLEGVFREIRNKTAKPFLISAFGIDAYDRQTGAVNPERQADSARARALDIRVRVGGAVFPLLGGIWAGYLDEWWRSGAAARQDSSGQTDPSFPDGELNPEWMGLFEATPADLPGFDTLRPRLAYFALAEQWGGRPPDGLSLSGAPAVDFGGVLNLASEQPFLAPGNSGNAGEFGDGARTAVGTRGPAPRGPLSQLRKLRPGDVGGCGQGACSGLAYRLLTRAAPWNGMGAILPWIAPSFDHVADRRHAALAGSSGGGARTAVSRGFRAMLRSFWAWARGREASSAPNSELPGERHDCKRAWPVTTETPSSR